MGTAPPFPNARMNVQKADYRMCSNCHARTLTHTQHTHSSLSSVEPPKVWFDLKLPAPVIDEVRLSSLQLEAVVYACQQHKNILADGSRGGYLVGKSSFEREREKVEDLKGGGHLLII